ncbi:MAG: hypothetical protein GF341_07615 [candidate division Zixibacteria bacterium]|nr:hypothetical protein [candidate division Zixibacteria bacterium]
MRHSDWTLRRALKLGSAITLMIFASLLLVTGCGNSPVAPTSTILDDTDDSKDDLTIGDAQRAVEFADSLISPDGSWAAGSDLEYLKDSPNFVDEEANKEEIGILGGAIKLQLDNEELYFVVPKGALDQRVEIEIQGYKLRTDDGRDVYLYECSPSGLRFSLPMKVDHPVSQNDGSPSVIFYKGDDLFDGWQLEQVSPVLNGSATFLIWHFSKYGIS